MHAFATLDPEFAARAVACGGGLVLAGDSLGHGEPREQAALVLASLGVRAVIARSWAPAFHRRLRDAGFVPDSGRLAIAADAESAIRAAEDYFKAPLTERRLRKKVMKA